MFHSSYQVEYDRRFKKFSLGKVLEYALLEVLDCNAEKIYQKL